MKVICCLLILFLYFSYCSCNNNTSGPGNEVNRVYYNLDKFCMGADLSYVNQIEDHGGIYKDSGQVRDVFKIFKNHGTNLIRLRIWHNPVWTKEVYGTKGTQLYSDLKDVEKSITRAKGNGMAVCLDFHYSDTWADPGHQDPPKAWKDISDISVLKDSIYNYTFQTLKYLDGKGLMPEMVQVGNEINCGMLITGLTAGFPDLNGCNDKWINLGEVINSGIKAIRDVSADSQVKTKILLHVADPKNITWWFDNIINNAKVSDFDIIGFSYYPLWHTTIDFYELPLLVYQVAKKYNRKVMILETAYPWTKDGADNYNNSFGSQTPVTGYDYSVEGQKKILQDFTQAMITNGLSGIIYWEPDWITSDLKDPWGTGSSFENSTFFDFDGNTLPSIDYMNYPYEFPGN
jgi:arabinogalactan endo-1,4-beta-galactosidase